MPPVWTGKLTLSFLCIFQCRASFLVGPGATATLSYDGPARLVVVQKLGCMQEQKQRPSCCCPSVCGHVVGEGESISVRNVIKLRIRFHTMFYTLKDICFSCDASHFDEYGHNCRPNSVVPLDPETSHEPRRHLLYKVNKYENTAVLGLIF